MAKVSLSCVRWHTSQDDISEHFCMDMQPSVAGSPSDALWFVQNYMFPPSQAELLSVRRTYKKHDSRQEERPSAESLTGYDTEADRDYET